tara:strand:+ start:59 stop:883 length:825 start_codon:yes stop_codon:yes gene_type:complete
MKINLITKFLGIMCLLLYSIANASAESVYDYLKKDLRFVGDIVYLNVHNNHGSKRINIDKVEIWFTSCDKYSGTADRIYRVDRFVKPYSEFEKALTYNFPYDGQVCYSVTARFIENSVRKIVPTKKKESWFKWWYLLAIPLSVYIYDMAQGSKSKNTKTQKTRKTKANRNDNLIEDLWEGKKPLGETFWLYFILINFIISFGSGFFSELYDNNLFVIPGAISNIFTMVAVWNSSTNYQLLKIKQKKPYGWAYAAKVIVVLNGLAFISQVVLLFE